MSNRITNINGREYWSRQEIIDRLKRECAFYKRTKVHSISVKVSKWYSACVWLDGEPLPFFRSAGTKFTDAEIVAKMIAEIDNPAPRSFPGLVQLNALAQELARCRDDILWLFRKWRKAVGRPKEKSALRRGRASNGQPALFAYVPVAFAEWARRRLMPDKLDEGETGLKDAADILGVPRGSMHMLRERHGIATRERRLHVQSGAVRPALTIAAADLEKIRQSPTPTKPEKFPTFINGRRETLLPKELALREFPHIPAYVYESYPDKPCPLIGGDVLVAPKTAWPNGFRVGSNLTPRGFVESQLAMFPRAKVKRPGFKRALEKHKVWKKWRDEGLSPEDISARWKRERREHVSAHGIRKALRAMMLTAEPTPATASPAPSTSSHAKVAFASLGITVDWETKTVSTDAGKKVGFDRSEVEWHIFKVALKAHPQSYSLGDLKANYPGEFEKNSRNAARKSLNKKLARIGLHVANSMLSRI